MLFPLCTVPPLLHPVGIDPPLLRPVGTGPPLNGVPSQIAFRGVGASSGVLVDSIVGFRAKLMMDIM